MYSKEQKEKLVLSVPYWWHSIDLGDGVITPGLGGKNCALKVQRLKLNEIDWKGKSVLDVGCSTGFFSFWCEKQGISRIVALDNFSGDNQNTRGFNVCKKILNSKVEYISKDITKISSKDIGQFDIVLFIDVLYHIRYPLLALDNLRTITKELLVLRSYCLSDKEKRSIVRVRQLDEGQTHLVWQPSISCIEGWMKDAGFNTKLIEVNPKGRVGIEGR